MLHGRDLEHALTKAMDYGGNAMTAYNGGRRPMRQDTSHYR